MRTFCVTVLMSLMPAGLASAQDNEKKPEKDDKAPAVYPVAIFAFEERGAGTKDYGVKVADLLFARLVTKPELYLVDRADMKKVLDEQSLNLSGAVKADEATKVGQLTGAKIIVTGSVIQAGNKLILVAKVIGTETTRVLGSSADGKVADDLNTIVEKLGDNVTEVITKQADKLVPKPIAEVDRVVAINSKLKKAVRPSVVVTIPERHIGVPTIDPAAQTELMKFCKETGFELLDADDGGRTKADVVISGEAFSETVGRIGNLVSVKARVELKITDRKSGKVLVADRQTVMIVDVAEQIAGKSALQAAAATLAERVLPKLATEAK